MWVLLTRTSSVTVPGLWLAFSQARISGCFITSLVLVLILAIVSATHCPGLHEHHASQSDALDVDLSCACVACSGSCRTIGTALPFSWYCDICHAEEQPGS